MIKTSLATRHEHVWMDIYTAAQSTDQKETANKR